MVLMAYFIDDDWVWHKRILNFCVIPNHKGNTTGRLVKACLNGWGIDKVFTISVDNASSNDGCISYMKKRLEKWNSLIGDGSLLHRQKGFERMEEDGPKFLEYFEEYEADATMMKRKFDKYWGNVNNINKLFFVTVILDPRYKMEYVEFCLDDLVSDENGVNEMSLEIKTLLHNLYDYYRKQNPAAAQVFHGNVESEGSLHVNNDVTKSSRLQKFLVKEI
ncbi:hypothetical protein L3X38_032564 [Prunus dulcis]|uniref:hAT-like transposase RNase-H fold domain-containing protein n=1 Tax=Prunus dulcis TaxID=3755 RepID=A0AAD4VGL0_PRUDU|nr:hypothetical protein L3X38_032564 [Prunus dulcis]